MFGVLGKHLPPPPEGFKPPVLWGMEERVNELFAGHKVHTQRERVEFEDESIDAWIEFAEHNLGPLVMTKAALEPDGKWEAARADLVSLYSKYNEADDGSARVRAEYLLTTVRPG
jgi:hypothetical protein